MSSEMCEVTNGEVSLETVYVDDDYFLLRVKQFEQKHKMEWGKFLGDYDSGRLDPNRECRDFVEWSFLCRTFLRELIVMDEGPPGDTSVFPEKPEVNSGFCFMCHLRNLNVRSRQIFRSDSFTSELLSGAIGVHRDGGAARQKTPRRIECEEFKS